MEILQWDGQKITKPGIWAGVPMSAYHGDICDGPSISSSGLRTIEDKSFKHYFETSYLNPEREEDNDLDKKEAIILGRAVHSLVGGESNFAGSYVLRPDEAPDGRAWNGNNLTCKAWLAEQALNGLTVLTSDQMKRIRRMTRSLAECPEVQAGILHGLVEHSIIWKDEPTGVWLKARPDVIPLDSTMVVDLKTTRDASWQACSRSVTDRGYHMQLALVSMGLKAAADFELTDYFLAWIETSAPYCAAVRPIDDLDIMLGARQLRRAIDGFARCRDSGIWPGYEDTDRPVTLTGWRRKELADQDEAKVLPSRDKSTYRPPWTREGSFKAMSEAN